MNNSRPLVRVLALLVGLLILATACSSSSTIVADSAAAPAENPTAVVTDPPATAPAIESAPEAEVEAAAAAPAAEASDVVEISLEGGPTWTLPATFCAYNPDASGPAAAIVNIAGEAESGANIVVLEAWPLDGNTDNGTSFIATFVDEDDTLYVFEPGEVRQAGDMVEVTSAVHTNLFYALGDEPAGIMTVRCQL